MVISILCLVFLATFAEGTDINNAQVSLTFLGGDCILNGETMSSQSVMWNNRCVQIKCDSNARKVEITGCPPTDEDFLKYQDNPYGYWPHCCPGYQR
uniref:Putative secreted protein n=1 Tax=Amblyomma americanum TaxID=6943 RepID=A0A0C9RVP5_AMBAM